VLCDHKSRRLLFGQIIVQGLTGAAFEMDPVKVDFPHGAVVLWLMAINQPDAAWCQESRLTCVSQFELAAVDNKISRES